VPNREFRDEWGVSWQVWSVRPAPTTEKKTAPQMEPGFENGWLVFSSQRERRRLAPIPDSWVGLPEAGLRQLLAASVREAPRSLHLSE
jgi:hypothetical protein